MPDTYYRLFLPHDDEPHGYMLPWVVEQMPWTPDFRINHNVPRSVHMLDSSNGTDTPTAVTKALGAVVADCIKKNLFACISARESELQLIPTAKYDRPVFVQRYAGPLFGFTSRGALMLAYTYVAGAMKIWIPRRADSLFMAGGKLDVTVAGGIKETSSPWQTIIEEAEEEASFPPDLIKERARPVGCTSHVQLSGKFSGGEKGLVMPDFAFCYDMELPADVVPRPLDGEVKEFNLMNVEDVKAAILRDEFKPEPALVLVDFLIRHGFVTAENEPDYPEIVARLHRRLPFTLGVHRK